MLFSILKYSIINIFLLDRNDVLYRKNKLFLRKININSFFRVIFLFISLWNKTKYFSPKNKSPVIVKALTGFF